MDEERKAWLLGLKVGDRVALKRNDKTVDVLPVHKVGPGGLYGWHVDGFWYQKFKDTPEAWGTRRSFANWSIDPAPTPEAWEAKLAADQREHDYRAETRSLCDRIFRLKRLIPDKAYGADGASDGAVIRAVYALLPTEEQIRAALETKP